MYLCRTLGELLRMHSGCFCYRSNNVWFWKEQGLVSNALTTPPSLFLCVMIKTCETARSNSLPLSKKGYWHLKSSIIYIYAQPPPKQKTKKKTPKKNKTKKKNRTMGIAGSPMGRVSLIFLVLFFFCFLVFCCLFFWFFGFFCFFFGFLPRGPPPKSLRIFFCWFNVFFISLPGILPKEYQNIVVFLFV